MSTRLPFHPSRRYGPVPNTKLRPYTVMLEDDTAEWGKHQPGGLSNLLRQLLLQERNRRRKASR